MACAALELLRALLLQKLRQLLFKLKFGGVGWELPPWSGCPFLTPSCRNDHTKLRRVRERAYAAQAAQAWYSPARS